MDNFSRVLKSMKSKKNFRTESYVTIEIKT